MNRGRKTEDRKCQHCGKYTTRVDHERRCTAQGWASTQAPWTWPEALVDRATGKRYGGGVRA